MKRLQQGFTLIELMISLILGLLVSAAALQILYTNSLSSNIQSAGSNIVDTNTFGLDYLTKQIRKANYGILSSQSFFLNHRTPQGGIVLTAPDNLTVFGNTVAGETVASNLRGLSKSNQQISDTLLTRSASSLSGSNVKFGSAALSSDQLTIQYKVSSDNQVDCQSRNVMKDDYVIERYFVRDGGLACASAIYTYNETTAQTNQINIDTYTKYIKGNFDEYPLWLCKLCNEPTNSNWTFWQYTHKGVVPGIKGNVDMNIFNGSYTDFVNFIYNARGKKVKKSQLNATRKNNPINRRQPQDTNRKAKR